MFNLDKNAIVKQWLPISLVVIIIVFALGFVLGISIQQIVLSIVISLILIFSGLLFQTVGRNKKGEASNSDTRV